MAEGASGPANLRGPEGTPAAGPDPGQQVGPAVLFGLPETCRADAVALYWQAFGTKLGRLLGPDRKAISLLLRVLRLDHAVGAIAADGGLIGVAGFRSPFGAFASFGYRELRAAYGFAGGGWRWLVLCLMTREVDNRRFLVDGIAVSAAWRGRGVGTALIGALAAEGARRGYRELRLEVDDSNARARGLYDRLGFVALRRDRPGLGERLAGLGGATVMTLPLRREPGQE